MNLHLKYRLVLVIVLVFGVFMNFVPKALAVEGRDCDDNAVIRCGTLSEAELKQKCQENAGDAQAIFREFGIANCDALTGLVEGRVTGKNEVFVGDKLVATNAMTAGRHDIEGSTPIAGGIAYKRPPSVSFVNKEGSLRALVKMEGNTFRFALITSCGNPVVATPVPAPPPPPATTTKTPPPPPPKKVVKPKPVRKVKVVKERPAPPPTLPETGAGEIIGMLFATSGGAYGAHQIVNRLAYRLRLK